MKSTDTKKIDSLKHRQEAPLLTPTDLTAAATKDIAGAMNAAHAVMAGNPDPTWRLYSVYGDLGVARVSGS